MSLTRWYCRFFGHRLRFTRDWLNPWRCERCKRYFGEAAALTREHR